MTKKTTHGDKDPNPRNKYNIMPETARVGVQIGKVTSGVLHVVSFWIDTLVLKTEGNTYATLLHHPFLFKGKTNASLRGSKKDFWRRCREIYAKPRHTKYPS